MARYFRSFVLRDLMLVDMLALTGISATAAAIPVSPYRDGRSTSQATSSRLPVLTTVKIQSA